MKSLETKKKSNERSKKYQQMKADEYSGYSVYYLPEEHYVGMSKNVYSRIIKHKHLGKIVDNYEVLQSFENPIAAHLMETRLHLIGYNGYRP